jgi:hypothetical protein
MCSKHPGFELPMRSKQNGCGVSIIFSLSQAIVNLRTSLIWPVIIAGSHTYGTDRTIVTEVFEAFRYVSE